MSIESKPLALPLTRVQWLICIIAAIGFAFDIYELLMLPLIIKPAIASLAPSVQQLVAQGIPADKAALMYAPGGAGYIWWARALFFLPALAGGIFGLLGGYLTDLLGRRRVLTFSILLYAFSAFAAGYSTSLPMLLALRCLVFIGVCVEFVAAVAWLAELFPDAHQRETVLGYTQAFSSLGGLMIGTVNVLLAQYAVRFPAIHGAHEAWRYTLISGVIPAMPLIILRPFLPESPIWAQKKATGSLRRASIGELFSPALIRATLLTTLVFAASYGIAFGAIQQLPQILRDHQEVAAIAKKSAEEDVKTAKAAAAKEGKELTPKQIKQIQGNRVDEEVAKVTLYQEVGGLVGRILLAILAVKIMSRRALLRVFQIPALFLVPVLFYWISTQVPTGPPPAPKTQQSAEKIPEAGKPAEKPAESAGAKPAEKAPAAVSPKPIAPKSLLLIQIGIFFVGLLTVAQFSFWGNYIPLVFPTHLRGTGESFAANIGGRILGTAAAAITLTLSSSVPPSPSKIALMAAFVAGAYALVGAILTQWLPEPSKDALEH